jgi:radical SAM superfamily enzyme YgiQ (UPF0313 family)
MKILITYPPINSSKGIPLLSQNRQFQYFKEPTYIYPVVPASAASMLSSAGFEVIWKDCIAENITDSEFLKLIWREQPAVVAIETKTPVIAQHWKIIKDIKRQNPHTRIALMGDHVTALPEESFNNSKVDFVLTGGDYDFLLLSLCKNLTTERTIEDYSKLEPGIYYRVDGIVKNTGKFTLNHDLDSAPYVNRDLTNWKHYAFKNGNFKKTPGTYIMSGRDCWWGKCTFCSWPTLYPSFRSRSVENVLDEIDLLINKYKVAEIMDDTGTFPVGSWLKEFCEGMIERGYNQKVSIDCNMRFGALSLEEYSLMEKAGFRLLLFGIESANQPTLDRINKNLKVEIIADSCKLAREAGLYPHITVMFGYPWESYEEALNTFNLGKDLLTNGYAYTMQATIVIPYPGTPLYEECLKDDLLVSKDWSYFDMKNPVMKLKFNQEQLFNLVQDMYSVSFSPKFLLKKISSIKDFHDLKYFSRALPKVMGHLFDFKKS